MVAAIVSALSYLGLESTADRTIPFYPAWAIIILVFVAGAITSFAWAIRWWRRRREFTDATPSGIMTTVLSNTDIVADSLLRHNIGQWMRVRGRLKNVGVFVDPVGSLVSFQDTPDGIYISYVKLTFTNKRVVQTRLFGLQPGTEMIVVGKIAQISREGIRLRDCEIELVVGSDRGAGNP